MQNKWILTAGVIIIVAGLFYAFNLKGNDKSETAVVSSLIRDWKDLEKTFPDRPVLGATAWNYPGVIQFISSDKLLIEYEDGHIIKYSVIGFDEKNRFTFIENVGKVNELSPADWNLAVLKYGNGSSPITFKVDSENEGIFSPSLWQRISENPFTKEKVIKEADVVTPKVSNGAGQGLVSKVKIALLIDSADNIYRGDGIARGCDKVVMVERQINPTTMPLNASLKLLFTDKTPWPYKTGVPGNFVGGRPDIPLTFSRATLENGVAKVYIYGNVTFSGVCDDPRLVSQVEETAFQFPSVKSVKIYVNDKEWTAPSGKGE